MSDTYSKHAHVCAKFYELTLDSRAVADFVMKQSGCKVGDRALFVGGMFEVAAALLSHGVELTVVDYTDEMVSVARNRLPHCSIRKADLRSLPFEQEFQTVFVIGRVFTHMTTDKDLSEALSSCRRALRPSGKFFVDNYEDSRIEVTKYFNGVIEVSEGDCAIVRASTTSRVSDSPFVVNWKAEYSGLFGGERFQFRDSIDHRAFSRSEFSRYLGGAGFEVLHQGDNFDETSFYTLSERNFS